MGKEESNEGIQNPIYADTESPIQENSNPPGYNQINQGLQQNNIAPVAVPPGQVHIQAGLPQLLTQPQYVAQPQYVIQPGQTVQPGMVQGNAVVQGNSVVQGNAMVEGNAVVYVQPNPQGLMPMPVQQGQQVVYIPNPDVNRVPGIFDCESPSYFVWFLLGCFCAPIAAFLTSRKLNEGCSAVRHILPFVALIVGITCKSMYTFM